MKMITKKIPLKHKIRATWQWIWVSFILLFAMVGGLFMSLIAAATSKKMKNHIGEIEQKHRQKYIDQGSSGFWEYYASPIPFVRLWSNHEDGDLGEPSGKQSVRCNGKERKFWNRYYWLAIRNPFNVGKRTIPLFHCIVEDCDIEYWGDEFVDDGSTEHAGWNFTIATHRKTRKKYYGYYSVKVLSNTKVRVIRLGFKIKPTHAGVIQDADDKDKAFTMRYQPRSKIN